MNQALALQLFDYDNGRLRWRVRPTRRSRRRVGDIAGCQTPDGRWVVGYQGQQWLLHRVVFLWHYGHMPALIDHINGNNQDNRIENLREASIAQNAWNAKTPRLNTSGVKGVYWSAKANKWAAQLSANKQHYWLGVHVTREAAEVAVREARARIHGEFSRHA